MSRHWESVVVGGGSAGLATSRALAERGVEHVVLERSQVGDSWRTQRWDSFRLNTPGWANGVLGPFARDDFATAPEVVARLDGLAADLPVEQDTPVESLHRNTSGYTLRTADRELRATTVVLATGNQNVPKVPAGAARVPDHVQQLHAAEFRNAAQLPAGAVLVVGSAQSGCQIAEDLAVAGRRVYLATSRVGRLPWTYRGRQLLEWLADAGFFDQRRQDLEDPAMARAAQPIVASGGRSLSLQVLARAGVTLLGRIVAVEGATVTFDDAAMSNVAFGDQFAARLRSTADAFIARTAAGAPPAAAEDDAGGSVDIDPCPALDLDAADVTSIIWCTGFTGDFSWVHLPVLDAAGQPVHDRGATAAPGVWFVGLPWLTSRRSGLLLGHPGDGERIAERVTAHLAAAKRPVSAGQR